MCTKARSEFRVYALPVGTVLVLDTCLTVNFFEVGHYITILGVIGIRLNGLVSFWQVKSQRSPISV